MKMLRKQTLMKRLLCIALSLVLVAGFAPMRAQAYTEKSSYIITSLKPNTLVTLKKPSSTYNGNDNWSVTYHLYKITVPASSYIKIQASTTESFRIFKTINQKKSISDSSSILYCHGSRTYSRVLPKGTYYIYGSYNIQKIKWTYTQVKNPVNYCRAKAYSLAAGKKRTLVFNYKYEFGRWFKIQLTKKKAITITSKYLDGSDYSAEISVFDSRGYRINTSELTRTTERTQVLPKGTYYIRVSRSGYAYDDYDLYDNRMCQFFWK